LRPREQHGQPGKEQEKDRVRAQTWALRRGGDQCHSGCVGRSALSHTFWASLNSCCRNAHLETSFWGTGMKRNNEGRADKDAHPHKPKLISGVYCEITAKVLWTPLLPLVKDKCKVSFSVLVSSPYTIFHRCFIKHTDQKTWT